MAPDEGSVEPRPSEQDHCALTFLLICISSSFMLAHLTKLEALFCFPFAYA